MKKLVTEGFMIVVSILLAFWINAWWEGHVEEQQRQQVLRQVERELNLVREVVLPQAMETSDQVLRATELLLAAAQSARTVPADSLHQDMATILSGYRMAAALPVIETLTDRGGFALIRDEALLRHLSNVLAFLSLVRQFESEEQQFIARELRPYVNAHYDRYGGMVATGYGISGIPDGHPTQDWSFLSDRTFSNLLVERRGRANGVRLFRRNMGVYADSAFVALQADLR